MLIMATTIAMLMETTTATVMVVAITTTTAMIARKDATIVVDVRMELVYLRNIIIHPLVHEDHVLAYGFTTHVRIYQSHNHYILLYSAKMSIF